jgi:cell division protein FtsI/penicillin-binding protein 2
VGLVFLVRLFNVQVLNHDQYKTDARSEQFKRFEIEAERGTLFVMDGDAGVPIAINESRYLIFVDPVFVKDKTATAVTLSPILGVPVEEIKQKLERDTRYEILKKQATKETKNALEQAKVKGVGWKEQRIRTYPLGQLASHTLGFVNDEGEGQYGVEGYLDDELRGSAGQVRAITDIQGTPLLQNTDNIVTDPQDGTDVVLSIDQTIQRIAEEQLKAGVEQSQVKSGSVVVLEADTGRLKAVANYPTYDATNYTQVTDSNVFKNKAVSDVFEPGSIIKPLTLAAALDVNAVSTGTTYYDPAFVTVDDSTIRNVTDLGGGTRSMLDILHYSLNTGAVYLLKQMGGGDITPEARTQWHEYLQDHYRFNKDLGIEQEESAVGSVPDPLEGDGLRVQYANTSFGQGVSMTMVHMASALGAVVNGGSYYQPTVIFSKTTSDGTRTVQEPKVLGQSVSTTTSTEMVQFMKDYIDLMAPQARRDGFIVGGKTGTAQVPIVDGGGYRTDVYNATFGGFVGRTKPKYIVIVKLDEGSASRNFSGFNDARPVFSSVVNGIMDNVPIVD